MIDHVGLEVSEYGRSKAFYEEALEPLGIGLLMDPDGNNIEAVCHTAA